MYAKNYGTETDANEHLRKQGFTASFKMEDDLLKELESGRLYRPGELKIVEMHRFEGPSNPSDMSIVFAIETVDGRKGVINSAYGVYGDRELLDFMDKVERME